MNKKNKLTIFVIAGIAIFLLAAFFLSRSAGTQSAIGSNRVNSESQSAPVKATATINKTFDFKAINQARENKDIKFSLTTVDRKDEIRVKGEGKRAVGDKDFILVRIEIENNNTERLAIAPSDLIRLEIDGKLYAPDYHNGNVILDPLSVKREIVSFLVPRSQENFTFQVGELSGKKEKIEVNF